MTVHRLAVLSMHTSPLAQPGCGDGGGMNVYVRELVSSLARAGVTSSVYVRRWCDDLPDELEVEQGFRVVHVSAGPVDLPKNDLHSVVDEFTDAVADHLIATGGVDALHANYWLSGVVGHRLKHRLDLPLVSTFHTLARVKAETGEHEPARRVEAEAEVVGCSDVILASCTTESSQLVDLYGASRARVEIVSPGVDHTLFSPGDRLEARRSLGLGSYPVLLFVGRIQPLKGLRVAIGALAELADPTAVLVVVGGPSGEDGFAELQGARGLVRRLGLEGRVRFVDPQPHHIHPYYYRAADVVVVPSRSESFGLVALEAAACGTPVVAAGVGGLVTLVEHGESGFLVEGRDPKAFARQIDRILGEPDLARRLSTASVQLAARYTWSTTAARLRRLYADVTARSLVSCS